MDYVKKSNSTMATGFGQKQTPKHFFLKCKTIQTLVLQYAIA